MVPSPEHDLESTSHPNPRDAEARFDVLLPASYDGIRMFDHPAPSWWQMTLAAMVIVAGSYGIYFYVVHGGDAPETEYRATLARYEAQRTVRETSEAGEVTEYSLAQLVAKPAIARGARVFASHCVSCHAIDGHGLSGPNLTDQFQIHGSTRMDLYSTIRSGVPWTAMPPWGGQLRPADLLAVTAFVISIRGTNLAGKPPQGPPVEPFQPPARL